MKHVFAYRLLVNARLKCRRRQNGGRSGRARFGRPPVSFLRSGGGARGGSVGELGRWQHPASGTGRVGASVIGAIAWPIRRRRRRWRVRCDAGGSCRRWWPACTASSWKLLDGFKRLAAVQQVVGWTTLSVRVLDCGRADGEGGDPGPEPRAAAGAGAGGGVDRAGVGA